MPDRRRTVFSAILLLAVGFAVGLAVWPLVAPPVRRLLDPEGERELELRRDARRLVDLVRADPWLPEGAPEFAAWEERRKQLDPPRLAALRERVHAYLDLQLAEWSDAAEIYRTGVRPERPSDTARKAQDRIRELLGPLGEQMVAAHAEIREQAYEASPRVAGFDPELPDYAALHADLVRLEPLARRRADRLTSP